MDLFRRSLVCKHPDWVFEDTEEDFAYDCIKTALRLRGLPPQVDRSPPTIWLVLDTATLFPYAEHGPSDVNLASLMQRATDPGHPLAMGASPRRIKVATSVVQSHPELQTWANSRGIELVRPQSGFDAGSMHVKFWRKMVESVLLWGRDWELDSKNGRHWWNGVQSLTEQNLAQAILQRVKVHQDPKIFHLQKDDYQRIKLHHYTDGLDSVKAEKYLDWRRVSHSGSANSRSK